MAYLISCDDCIGEILKRFTQQRRALSAQTTFVLLFFAHNAETATHDHAQNEYEQLASRQTKQPTSCSIIGLMIKGVGIYEQTNKHQGTWEYE